jgi:Ca-activated chloride channel family protein
MTRLLLLATVMLVTVQQDPGPQVIIHAPTEDEFVSGAVTILASITGGRPDFVTFYVDGIAACRAADPPWRCTFDFGDTVREHHVRVLAEFRDGRRVAASMRTRPLDLAEVADVDAVLIPVSVRKDGRFIKGLTQDAFQVREDGKPQQITFFAAEGLSLELMVTMDVSGSMDDDMPQMREAVKAFLDSTRPNDRSTLTGFNTNFFVVANREATPEVRRRAIDRVVAWGGTALYDALVRSADMLQRRPGRKAIVVFTDGEDQSSRTSPDAAERRMEASDAILYVIGQGTAGSSGDLRRRLERLARISGGRAFFTTDISELKRVFGEIIEDLANQYAIGYTPERPADGAWRRIDVDVRGNYEVRARQGYRAVKRQGS